MDGSNFDQMDEATSDTMSLQNVDMHTTTHRQSNSNNDNSSISSLANINVAIGSSNNINPIDKLYLMQNSYFNSEH